MYIYIYIYLFIKRFLYTMRMLSVHHVHHVPKCMSCHKATVVITGRAHWFHDYICVTPILLL